MAENENLNRLIKRLQALASHEGGNENERKNAHRKLQEIIEAHQITETEIEQSEIDERVVKHDGTKEGRYILIQVISKVTNRNCGMSDFNRDVVRKSFSSQKIRNNYYKSILFQGTELEQIEVEFLYDFYRKLYKKELEMFIIAFINKHQLFR